MTLRELRRIPIAKVSFPLNKGYTEVPIRTDIIFRRISSLVNGLHNLLMISLFLQLICYVVILVSVLVLSSDQFYPQINWFSILAVYSVCCFLFDCFMVLMFSSSVILLFWKDIFYSTYKIYICRESFVIQRGLSSKNDVVLFKDITNTDFNILSNEPWDDLLASVYYLQKATENPNAYAIPVDSSNFPEGVTVVQSRLHEQGKVVQLGIGSITYVATDIENSIWLVKFDNGSTTLPIRVIFATNLFLRLLLQNEREKALEQYEKSVLVHQQSLIP